LRPALGILMDEFVGEKKEFIARDILTPFGVEIVNGQYPVIPLEALLEIPDTSRAPRSAYGRGDWEFEMDTFDCSENGIEEPVDDVEAEMFDSYFAAEEVAARIAMGVVLRNHEIRVSNMLFNDANFTPHALGTAWSDHATSTPMSDVKTAILAVHNACGLVPDTLVVSLQVYYHLSENQSIIDRIKYSAKNLEAANISREALAKALGVERILVGEAMRNTAKKGQAASLAQIWSDDYAMLCVTADEDEMDLRAPCIGRTFQWTKDVPENIVVESYREPQVRATIIRCREFCDEDVMFPACAHLFTNVV